MQYFFILGKNPILSEAEIVAVLEFNDIKFKILKFLDRVLVVDLEKELDVDWLNARLGGTVKIGKILDQMYELDEFEDKFLEQVHFGTGKAFYGFSLYPLYRINHIEKYQKRLNAIAMNIKSRLRDEKQISSRYVVSKEPELSSVIVAKNKLLKNGAEICFFIDEEVIIFGQTLAVQAFEEFGARDYNRPGRDKLSGMLPPKLARMMINLAQVKPEALILDPFCGSGTVLQEAVVLGYTNLIGSDISDKAIEDTKKNLEWLELKSVPRSGIPLRGKSLKSKVMKLDVKELSSEIKVNSIDAIVTEPFLGPAMRGNESRDQVEKTIEMLESLYLAAFVQFAKVLVKGGKVVMVFPVFNIRNQQSKIEILSQVQKLGFVKLNKEELEYYREGQFVRREILIFEKV